MNSRLYFAILLLTCRANSIAQSHNFSVKDDIAMARFTDPSAERDDPSGSDTKYSPNGQYAAIITTRGLLASDQVESTVFVFDLNDVKHYLHDPSLKTPIPHIVAVVSARPAGEQMSAFAPAIKDLRWSSDSRSLYFLRRSSEGTSQVAEVGLSGGDVHTLTPAGYDVDRFDISRDRIVYLASPIGQARPTQGEAINRDALDVTGVKLADIVFPGRLTSYYPKTYILGIAHPDSKASQQVPGYAEQDITVHSELFPFKLSPNGRQLISMLPVSKVSSSWKAYNPVAAYQQLRLDGSDPQLASPENALRPREYGLTDLSTGRTVPLIAAPNAWSLGHSDVNTAVWSTDGSRVLVTNVFLPLEEKAGASPQQLNEPCAVASVDLPSLHARCLLFRNTNPPTSQDRVEAVRFGKDADEVIVSATPVYSVEHKSSLYRLRGGRWISDPLDSSAAYNVRPDIERSAAIGAVERPKVFIRQALNDPPTLWASDSNVGRAREIWDPNPQLKQIGLGEASVYRWKDHTGREWTGGLVKPIGYLPGHRYPLVIQMYQFRENEFLTDGTEPSAFAARELASVGFMVLQIRKKPSLISEADPQIHLDAYESAIDSLSQAGMIDRSKVGAVGFSWTCWYVVNAIVKAPKLFAAATVADGLDNSYMQYVLFAPGATVIRDQMDRIRGGGPIGSNLDRWIKESPAFHLDQVLTPVRIEVINPASVLQEWELYSSLYMQHKPVDLIYFPEGTHIHQRPLERLESQQGNIDWLRFWLQGYEDPDPRKSSLYERWRAVRCGSISSAARPQH
ncbi:hypothetical protein [Granulicella paludicola]|uniref:hypothetical protein n=1 Tax=Granulicella paludicola TaxID=474951 RepID=UPI0021E038A7|nr:hypothetical protein [Granulicella paludicola]